MIRIGITGQDGFLGQHLYNTLGLFPGKFERVPFNKDFFDDEGLLAEFTAKCDVIVHLAAVNRHSDPQVIYDANIGLVEKLVAALHTSGSRVHVLFSSSTQEERGNLYGKSKKEGRTILARWAKQTGGKFTGLVIPNVFGPFGKPCYNSFIATFSHQLCHNEIPRVEADDEVSLLYVGELVNRIICEIETGSGNEAAIVAPTATHKVSEILALLTGYKTQYLDAGIIPALNSAFEVNLFNTFRSYIPAASHYPVKFTKHTDQRGAFVEVMRLHTGGQVSFSTTAPGVTRGNHFHTRKIERFAVIKGDALIQLRRTGTGEVLDFHLSGKTPAYVDMPVWYTHNIKNTGTEELYTIFWINEFFDPNDTDTYFENV